MARERGHEVIGFSRNRKGEGFRKFSMNEAPDLTGCDAVVNLAGASVVGFWTEAKRRAIRESRVLATRRVVEGINKMRVPPRMLVNGSATGIYGDTGDQVADEEGQHGSEFLAEVCEAWESEAARAREAGVRVVCLRTGVVLSPEGGALAAMLPVFKLGLGGKLGNGRQWMSWIHLEDEAALILAALEGEAFDGAVNATAPNPVRNADFTRALARALGRPAFLWVPAFVLRAALGGFSAEVLESRRIVPAAAGKAGFVFKFPELGEALKDLVEAGK